MFYHKNIVSDYSKDYNVPVVTRLQFLTKTARISANTKAGVTRILDPCYASPLDLGAMG